MRHVSTDHAPAARGHYSQAIVHGGLVYVAGQLPIDPAAPERRLESFEEQAGQVLSNVIAILQAAGSSAGEIVKATVYITDIAHWPAFNALYAKWTGGARPARCVVPVPQLHYGFKIEIEAVAVK